MPTTIRQIRVILTAPEGINLIVVKIETSEPGLYGLGCATFAYRQHSVAALIQKHLAPLLVGREVARIEELWQLMNVNAYWRNGPELNNAISGIDMALWDIKGKQAGLPVYELLGGKVREAAAVYRHTDGRDLAELLDRVRGFQAEGVRHVRVQFGWYGGGKAEDHRPEGAQAGAYYDPRAYTRRVLQALEHVRATVGSELELLHDVHSRLTPALAVDFAKEVEPLRLFFLEDILAPEDLDWLENIRRVTTTPLAIGELFNHPREWIPLITGRRMDFMRMHLSQMGGLTPARKAAILGELHGVRTAWHGPGDLSPVGHAANLHLDLVSANFGIQEFGAFGANTRAVFSGCPELRAGYLYPNARPGLGVDLDETAAAKFPCDERVVEWTQVRLPDGSLGRP